MATKVRGKDIIFSVWDDPVWKPVACNISCELTSNLQITGRLPLAEGKWKEFRGDSLDWAVFCENILILDDDDTKAGLPLLIQSQHNMLELLAQFTIESGGLEYVFSGKVIIPSIVLSGAVNDFGRGSFEFQGTGPLTISNDLPVPIITITVTGAGTGQIQQLILRNVSTLEEWSFVGSISNGSTETWVLSGFGGQPGPGEYYIEAVVESEEEDNHFSTDAPPTANVAVGSGVTNLNSAPFGNTVAFDFTQSRTITFTIEGVNDPPVADAGDDQTIELPSSTTILDGSGSTDDGTIVTYLWEYVSGPGPYTIVTGAFPVTEVTGLVEGTYVFRLTVTDDGGLTDSDEVTITVDPDPSPGEAITIQVTGAGSGEMGAYVRLFDPSNVSIYWTSPTFNLTPGTTVVWPLNGIGSNPPPGTYYLGGYVDSNEPTNHMITDAPPTANELFTAAGQSLVSLTYPTTFDFTTSRTITFLIGS